MLIPSGASLQTGRFVGHDDYLAARQRGLLGIFKVSAGVMNLAGSVWEWTFHHCGRLSSGQTCYE